MFLEREGKNMIDKRLKVKDMPHEVMEACSERGHGPDAEMSIEKAMAEWTAWELGDGSWGRQAARYVEEMATKKY